MYYASPTKNLTIFIYKILCPFKFPMLIMSLVVIIYAIDKSLRPYLLKIIIDNISEPQQTDILARIQLPAILYFSLTLGIPTCARLYDYFIEIKMFPNLRFNIANVCFNYLLKQSYSYYQNNFAGSLVNKLSDLRNSIPELVEIIINGFFSHSLALIFAIFTLWQVNSIFSIGILIWSIIFILGSGLLLKKFASLSNIWSELWSRSIGELVDTLANILSVRLFAREKEEYISFSKTFNSIVTAEQKLEWAYIWLWFFYEYSFVAVQGLSLYLLCKGRQGGWITAGDFVVVLSINFAIVDILWHLTKNFSRFYILWGRIAPAFKVIIAMPEIQDHRDARILKITQGTILFHKVKFNYKNTKSLFKHMSIIIHPGQKVGLVGYSGSGKSTFVNLILRLYDVTRGNIFIDNQDIRKVTQDSLHNAIAMIPQEPSLFHRTLIENIRYGSPSATDHEVIQAAKKAYAHDFIIKLSQKYHSLVGERGIKLSGGQRQRIAIARAILKNAPILVIDEATSQLDSITERKIQTSLWKLMQGKTTIVIAHRLSTLLNMDRILVFEQGKIIEDGTHNELLAKNGYYKTLWDAQIGGMLPDRED
jgi:ATP-binding cassette, subfamily B, bacterial